MYLRGTARTRNGNATLAEHAHVLHHFGQIRDSIREKWTPFPGRVSRAAAVSEIPRDKEGAIRGTSRGTGTRITTQAYRWLRLALPALDSIATASSLLNTNADVERLLSQSQGKSESRKAGLLAGLATLKPHYPEARAVTRTFKRAASADPAATGSRRISILGAPYSGYAKFPGYRVVYRPGCFGSLSQLDVRILFAHSESQSYVLGRVSAGTAKIWDSPEGIRGSCDAPPTTWANDLLEQLALGNIDGACCGFFILESEWQDRREGRYLILTRCVLHDLSVESFPTYSGTTVDVGGRAAGSGPRTVDDMEAEVAALRMLDASPSVQAAMRAAEVERLR